MATRILGPTRSRRRRRFLLAPIFLIVLAGLLVIASASGVLPGSPSNFESNDGNMIVDTAGNSDWANVAFTRVDDAEAVNSDDSFEPGQKQDTTCPVVEGHKNPPKDDFTDIAEFTETNETTGDTYLYGATIRVAANGNASENVELNKGTGGTCPGSTLLARVAGDKLIAIDYVSGGPQFHVLTWVTSGTCFVSNDLPPCWGADVAELDPAESEGAVNSSPITAANNPINNTALVAGQFAEFGVNLGAAGIIPPGSCESFTQTVFESRSSGSSFVSSVKDISISNRPINVCANLTVLKLGSDGGSQDGAVFTLYEGSDTTGNVVGTCTVLDGNCENDDGTTTFPPSFEDLAPGTYTIDETTVPPGYAKDPSLPFTFTLAQDEQLELTFTDPALEGALRILKNSTKGGAVTTAEAVFSYDGASVTDNGTGDEDSDIGEICVSGLDPGDYLVDETSPPPGYGGASEAAQTVTVVNGTNCTDNPPGAGATATFTNPPLSDIQVNFRDGGSDETSAVISCDNTTGTGSDDPAAGWDTSRTVLGLEAPTTVTCTITIDP
jgi:Prealbumin-like fold domain